MFYLCAKVTVYVYVRLKNEIKMEISHDVIQVFCIIVKCVAFDNSEISYWFIILIKKNVCVLYLISTLSIVLLVSDYYIRKYD